MNASSSQQKSRRNLAKAATAGHPDGGPTTERLITLFAIPKPFVGSTGTIQRNAISSWKQLEPEIDVVLLGDEPGIAEAAQELGVQHVPGIQSNELGTPLISSAFELAHTHNRAPLLMYCNSDVILTEDIVDAAKFLSQSTVADRFVAFGRRTELKVDWPVRFDSQSDVEKLMTAAEQQGRPASVVCKEYFLFPRSLYQDVPAFAVGRGNWDNWMISDAKNQGTAVVNVSDMVTVLHQSHEYQAKLGNRLACYVSGVEAQRNRKLAGGRRIASGASGTWRYTQSGLNKTRFHGLNPEFWQDLPRFGQLLFDLYLRR